MESSTLLIIALLMFSTCKSDHLTHENSLDTLMKEYFTSGRFNGAVCVSKKGNVLLNKAYGYMDENDTEVLSPDSKFGIGSIYKEFPAVAIMYLVERGQLDPSDSITKYLSALPNWAENISIEHLLQYSSGLPKIDFERYFNADQAISDSTIWNDVSNIEALEFEPGSNYLYTNLSPFLLIKTVEVVSGNEFFDFVEQNFFTPAKMTNTVIKDRFPYRDIDSMAIPFNKEGIRDQYTMEASNLLFTSTTIDLVQWMLALHSFKFIKPESVLYLTQKADVSMNGIEAPLGNCQVVRNVIQEHYHHGSMGNYEALVKRYNESDITISILTNQKNSNLFEIMDRLYLYAFQELEEPQ